MKEYLLCFIHQDRPSLDRALQYEMDGGERCVNWIEKLEKRRQFINGNALHSSGIRISGKERTVTDRTGSEIKELIGGYFLVKAENLDDVTQSVKENYWEFDRNSSVEIREVVVFEE